MTKRWLIVLFSCAAILRLGFVWVAPAWYDENFTLLVSRLPFAQMLQAVAGDVHPPLWYLIVWPLGQLHAPIWALRIPAALFSLAALWLFWRLLQRLYLSARVQVAALLLMACMPVQLYYALEARMYTLLECFVLLGTLALLDRRWPLFTLAGLGLLYSQYYGIFYFASLCLCGLVLYRKEELVNLFLSGLTAALGFLPWVIAVLLPQMGTLSGTYWMQLTGVGMVLRVFFQAMLLPPSNAVAQIPLMLAAFAWLFAAMVYTLKMDRGVLQHAPILMLAFLPFLFATLFSLVWQPVLHFRPLIGISPFLYILMAQPVEALFNEDRLDLRRALITAIFIIPLILVCDGTIYAELPTAKLSGASREMAYIRAHWQPGDIVYHYQDDSWVNTAAGNSLPAYRSPDCALTLGALSPLTRTALGMQIVPLASLAYTRAWLLWSDGPLIPPCQQAMRPAGQPQLVANSDEYVFDGLWLTSK